MQKDSKPAHGVRPVMSRLGKDLGLQVVGAEEYIRKLVPWLRH